MEDSKLGTSMQMEKLAPKDERERVVLVSEILNWKSELVMQGDDTFLV